VFIIAEENYESTLNCVNIHTLLKYKTSKLNEIPVTIDPLDMALIEFTSGTNNGKRKAVIKTNLNLINSIHQLQHSDILFNEEEDILVSISFGKIFGISYFLNSLISGSKIVMIPENFDSDGFKFVENIEKFKVTKLLLFTSDVEFMINHEVNLVFNISSIKEILHIGLFEDYNRIRQRVESMFKCRFFRSGNSSHFSFNFKINIMNRFVHSDSLWNYRNGYCFVYL
jgi:acyl-coenzyme A synthetase/AMP-(fatty) acid ligase